MPFREAVDRVTVAVDHGGGAVGGPQAALASPVRLDDIRHDHEQRVGIRCLRGEQGLGGLAQARLVGQQKGSMSSRRSGDHLRLVRAISSTAPRCSQGGRRGQ